MKNHWILKNECLNEKPLGNPKMMLKNECQMKNHCYTFWYKY